MQLCVLMYKYICVCVHDVHMNAYAHNIFECHFATQGNEHE